MPEPPAEPELTLDQAGEREPLWQRLEVGWPLSILVGFAGTWLGLLSGLPAAAGLLAYAGFAPLYRAQLRAGRRLAGALLAVLWILGIVGAAVGVALEGGLDEVLRGLPLAPSLARSELAGAGADPLATLPRNALLACALLMLARIGWGLVALAGSTVCAGALAGVAAASSQRAVADGLEPSLAALAGLPPHLFLALLAVQLGVAALAEPGFVPREPFTDLRRALLWSAVGVAGLALGFQGFWVAAWRSWQGG